MKFIFVAGIGIAVFIEFLLISKKRKSTADGVLTLWMFLIILHLFLFYLFFTGNIFRFPFLLGLEHPLPLLHGVFLFLYVCFVTKQLPRDRRALFLHFLPAVIMYAYLLSFILLPADQKILVYENRGAGYEGFKIIHRYAVTFSGVIYVAWSAILLRRHGKSIRDRFSDLEKVNLRWLQILTFGLGGIWLLLLIFQSDTLVFSGVVVFVFLIGFFGIRQGDILAQSPPQAGTGQQEPEPLEPQFTIEVPQPRVGNQQPGVAENQPEIEEQKKKYTKSGLKEEVAEQLHQALLTLMKEKELYRKSDLSIVDLALELGVLPNYLSQVINQKEQKNFYDFVNTYRIDAFKRLIEMNKNHQFTLLSLAYDCGFSSKTSFNRCFKKATGQTPSEYAATASRA